MLPTIILGGLPRANQLVPWLLRVGVEKFGPEVQSLVADPSGYVGRVGEVLVWNSDKGRRVIAGLQGVAESQERVEQAIAGIEATQMGMAGSLHALQAVSMATLGTASLSAACILWRLNALNKRLGRLESSIADIEEHLSAQDKAHLRQGVSKLREYEQSGSQSDLLKARDESQYAANVCGDLARREAQNKLRLPVLNYRGRCYLVALMTEVQSRILLGGTPEAMHRLEEEQGHLQAVAKGTFQATMGTAPEVFLDPNLSTDGVTLDLITEVYRQAHSAGAIGDVEIRDANQMFEYLRPRLFDARAGLKWAWSLVGNAKQECLDKLRYLLACLEDTNRINGLRLLISACQKKQMSLPDVAAQVEAWRKQRPDPAELGPDAIVAYAIA